MTGRTRWGLAATVGLGAALRFIRLGRLSLIGDESYYWLWSQHLDWSYYDHPAGVGLLIRASTALGGSSEAGVRGLNALLGLGCVFLTYQLGRHMLSERASLFAAALVATGAPYVVTSRLVYTNTLHLFLLLLNLCTLWRLLEEPDPRAGTTIGFGLSLALLLNIKYSAYLYAAAVVAAVLLDHRRLLANRWFWIGATVGALGLVPAMAWNAAHGWASYRWQLAHAATNLSGTYSLLVNARHALAYLTWPLVAAALAGVGRWRTPAERLLALISVFLILPVALSPANSPRNLSEGFVLLFLLAGARAESTLRGRWRHAIAAVAVVTVLIAAAYGVGTFVSLSYPSGSAVRFQSSVVPGVLKDAAGWRSLGPALAAYRSPIFALDYSIASQIWYYGDRPAYTSWGQYRLWEVPPLENVVVVSLGYLPQDLVSARLGQAFRTVQGPERLQRTEYGTTKELRVWQANDLRWDGEVFLREFDFRRLLGAAR